MKIVRLHRNWADEFDVIGFSIMTDEEYEAFKEAMDKLPEDLSNEEFEFYFGTNEAISWTTKSAMERDIISRDITKDEVDTIKGVLGMHGNEYGLFPVSIDILQDIIEDLKEESHE